SSLGASIDRIAILWSPSRDTSAILPSGVNAALHGCDLLLPKSTFPAAVTLLPEIVKTDTVPSPRLATRAMLPARFIEMPAGEVPASIVSITAGGSPLG